VAAASGVADERPANRLGSGRVGDWLGKQSLQQPFSGGPKCNQIRLAANYGPSGRLMSYSSQIVDDVFPHVTQVLNVLL
jgi:hypothetical protein